MPGTYLLLLFPNRTWKQATTYDRGDAAVDLHTTRLPMTVFASAPGHAARMVRDWIPGERTLAIDLEAMPTGGSVIFPQASGHLPGLKGALNPVRDARDWTFLCASNIATDTGWPPAGSLHSRRGTATDRCEGDRIARTELIANLA